eukprot:2690109-Rhodomonas_salina.4
MIVVAVPVFQPAADPSHGLRIRVSGSCHWHHDPQPEILSLTRKPTRDRFEGVRAVVGLPWHVRWVLASYLRSRSQRCQTERVWQPRDSLSQSLTHH